MFYFFLSFCSLIYTLNENSSHFRFRGIMDFKIGLKSRERRALYFYCCGCLPTISYYIQSDYLSTLETMSVYIVFFTYESFFLFISSQGKVIIFLDDSESAGPINELIGFHLTRVTRTRFSYNLLFEVMGLQRICDNNGIDIQTKLHLLKALMFMPTLSRHFTNFFVQLLHLEGLIDATII